MIEAIITLYANQLLNRERVIPILNSFGHTLRPGKPPLYLFIPYKSVRTLEKEGCESNLMHFITLPDAQSPEDLVISWINSAVLTLKAYIRSNAPIPSVRHEYYDSYFRTSFFKDQLILWKDVRIWKA